MDLVKRILAIIVIIISVVFIVVFVAGVVVSWSLNTPLTETTTRALTGVERVLEAADNGLERVGTRLGEAQANVDTIEGKVQEAGDTLSENSLVYEVLDRTVGDELFPKINGVRETVTSVGASVVAFNETLEAINEIPLVEVPTLTAGLEDASDRIGSIQSDVEETRAELRSIREEAISKPVTAITERTGRISTGLENVQTITSNTQANIDENLDSVAEIKDSVPGFFDLISVILTFIFLWLAFGQAGLIVLAWGYVRSPKQLEEANISPQDEEE
jgi:chromosome segregation ATPase